MLADTHLRDYRLMPEVVSAAVEDADVVFHAGDVTERSVLDELAARARVLYAVLGNNDRGLADRLPETLAVELSGVAVALVHDSGPARGRPRRLARRFPQADVVVFGHSHIPLSEPGEGAQWLFNPGSPTQRRRQPQGSFGMLVFAAGKLRSARIVPVGS